MSSDIEELLASLPDPAPEPLALCGDIPETVRWDGPSLITNTTIRERDIDCVGGLITWSFSDKKFRHFATHDNFIQHVLSIDPIHRTFCERIYSNQGQKLRLDIDSDGECSLTAADVRAIASCVQDAFEIMFGRYVFNEHIYVCDSSRADKQSLHVIIGGHYVISNLHARRFAENVRDLLYKDGRGYAADAIDMNVYCSATGLRAPYNYKSNVNSVKKIPRGVNAADVLITNIAGCTLVTPIVECPTVQIQHLPLGSFEKYVNIVLEQIPGHRFRNSHGSILNFDRCKSSACHISGKLHSRDNTLFTLVTNGKLYAKCRHCPGSLLLYTEVGTTDEAGEMIDGGMGKGTVTAGTGKVGVVAAGRPKRLPVEIRKEAEAKIRNLCSREYQHKKINAENITEYCGIMNEHGDYMNDYPTDLPTLHIKATMGCGKTEALKRHIAKVAPKSVLVISHRVSFTIDICAKLGYKSYQMVDGEINDTNSPFVVVQCESLHRVSTLRYEMVICDEVESIMAQMFAPTHRRANLCWRVFDSLLKFCDRLITMDGNLSQETIDVLSQIREDRALVIHNTVIPQISRHKITTNKEVLVAIMMKLIGKGDRVVVPTSSLKMAKKLYKMIRDKYPDKIVRMYNSETSAEEREATLRDVNASWRDCSVLIYTPTISAGISFTLHHFDSFVSFWYDSSCDVFTAMQMSRRARHISTGVYYHYVCETGHKLPDTPAALIEYVSRSVKHACEYMEDPDAEFLPNGGLAFDDTPRFRAWVLLHVRKNYSQTHFLESLIRELKLIGGVVEPLITSAFDGNIAIEKAVRGRLRALGEEIRNEDAESIAAAAELGAEEITSLSQGVMPDRAAIQKYYLRKCYNYSGEITPEIVRTYGETKLQLQYHARRNLRMVVDEVFENPDDAIKIMGRRFCNVMISDFACADSREVDNLRKLFEFARDSICVKLLRLLDMKLGEAKILSREDVVRKLTVGHKWISDNYKFICETFGVKVGKVPAPNDANYLKHMLEFINGKLKSRYGVSLKLTDKNSTNYYLDDPFAKLFNNLLEIPEPTK